MPDLEKRIMQLEKIAETLLKENEALKRRLIGNGVIENQGNRVKLDISAAISEFAKKTDIPDVSGFVSDVSNLALKSEVKKQSNNWLIEPVIVENGELVEIGSEPVVIDHR